MRDNLLPVGVVIVLILAAFMGLTYLTNQEDTSGQGVLGGIVTQNEGTYLGIAPILNFIGTGVDVTYDSLNSRVDVDMSAGVGAPTGASYVTATTEGGLSAERVLTGTASRVTVTDGGGPAGTVTIDIAGTYVGQSSITTLGTIGTGTWQGTVVADAYIADDITLTNITQITNRSHTSLTGTGTNTHTQIDTHLAGSSDPHGATLTQTTAVVGTLTLEGGTYDTSLIAGSPAASISYTLPSNTGTTGQYLKLGASNVWTWDTPGGSAAHNLLSATHTDTVESSSVLGGMVYANSTPAWQQLAGNTTTTKRYLTQTGTGTVSAAPVWDTIVDGDLPSGMTRDLEWDTQGEVETIWGVTLATDSELSGHTGDSSDPHGATLTQTSLTVGGIFKVLEGGSTPTLYGIFSIADLSTGDKTYTFPDATGEVTLLGQTIGTGEVESGVTLDSEWDTQGEVETIWGVTLATDSELSGHTGDASDPHGSTLTQTTAVISTLTLEGGTYDTSLIAGTPTASVTYTWPLADGTNLQVLHTNGSGVLSWGDDDGGGGSGDITDVGDVSTGAAFTSTGTAGTSLWFYDAQGRGQLTIADLTAIRTFTLPDASGEITLLGQTIATTEVESGVTLDTEWDTQGEVETIWGVTLATDAELTAHTGDASDPHSATLSQTNLDIGGIFRILEGGVTPTLYGTFAVADLTTSGKTYTFPDATGTVITTGNLTGITATGTVASGTWNGSVVGPVYGGTGVANNVASTITISGAYGTTFTLTGTTALTLPTSGTVTALGNTTTGSGSIVLATSPSLVTPALGVATATSLNGLIVTTTAGTLTIANNASAALVTSGNYSITLTATGATNVTLPTTGTLSTLVLESAGTNGTATANAGDDTTAARSDHEHYTYRDLVWFYNGALATGDPGVWIRLDEAGASGDILSAYAVLVTPGSTSSTIDILFSSQTNIDGTPSWSTIFTNKLLIDANERSTNTASTPPSLSVTSWSANDHFRINVDSAGTSAANATVKMKIRVKNRAS